MKAETRLTAGPRRVPKIIVGNDIAESKADLPVLQAFWLVRPFGLSSLIARYLVEVALDRRPAR